jgi:hypothetical protein
MGYLQGYEHDVFISYAHGERHGAVADRLTRWTQRLASDLADEIQISLKIKSADRRVSVWIDTRLQGNGGLTDTLKQTVERSAIFVPVMSPYYLQGQWCATEAAWFAAAYKATAPERTFVVRALETDPSDWYPSLKDAKGETLKGYQFYPPSTDHDDVASRPFGWPEPLSTDQDYSAAVCRLASEIARQLRKIEGDGKPSEAPPRRNVYLGYMHDTVEDRDDLRTKLEQAGYNVLPPIDEEPFDETSLREDLASRLASCVALVLIANEFGGTWPRDEPGGFIGLQMRCAEQIGLPCLTWLRANDFERVKRPAYRSFLETLAAATDSRTRYQDLDEFCAAIGDATSAPADAGDSDETEANAVICQNRSHDDAAVRSITNRLKRVLRETGRGNFAFDFGNPNEERIKLSKLERRIRDADAVLIVCFDQDWDWARPLLRQLNLLNHLRHNGKARLLVAAPVDTGEGIYDAGTLGFETIDVVNGDLDELESRLKSELPPRAALRSDDPALEGL